MSFLQSIWSWFRKERENEMSTLGEFPCSQCKSVYPTALDRDRHVCWPKYPASRTMYGTPTQVNKTGAPSRFTTQSRREEESHSTSDVLETSVFASLLADESPSTSFDTGNADRFNSSSDCSSPSSSFDSSGGSDSYSNSCTSSE